MNKKLIVKILFFIIMCIMTVTVIMFVNVTPTQKMKLSFNVETSYDQDEEYQLFYISNNEEYSELNKTEVLVSNNQEIIFEFPQEAKSIRLDLGSEEKDLILNNTLLYYGENVLNANEDAWADYYKINDIDNVIIQDNKIELHVNAGDPYIAWNLAHWNISDLLLKSERINILIKTVIIILIWMMFFVIIKRLDFFLEFPVEIFQSKALVIQLSKNDFMTRYAGSVFGIFWAFVQPIITVLIYWFVFEKGFHNGPVGDTPFVLWMISGLVPWFFFSDAVNGGTDALISYNYLVKKVVFKIDILPLVKILSAGFIHLFFVGFTIVLFIVYGRFPGIYVIQLIYYSLCTLLLALGISYATSAIVGFFRDLTQIINIVLMIGIWLTPIMWNFETLSLPSWIKTIFILNPVFYIVQGYRDSMINHIWFWQRPAITVYFWILTIFVLGIGTMIFKKLKVHFADVL